MRRLEEQAALPQTRWRRDDDAYHFENPVNNNMHQVVQGTANLALFPIAGDAATW